MVEDGKKSRGQRSEGIERIEVLDCKLACSLP